MARIFNSTRSYLQNLKSINLARNNSIGYHQPLGITKSPQFSTTSSLLSAGKSWHKMEGPHLFSFSVLKKHYEILPLILIVGGGITFLLTYVVRIALTRDDVRYMNSSKMPYETTELENARKRKFLVFNQNYDTIDELKGIYKDMYPEQDTKPNDK